MEQKKFKKGEKHVVVPEEVVKRVKIDKTDKIIYAIIFILSFAVYGNTVFNDYALDDAIVITQNSFTKKGFDGIGDILSNELFTGFFGKQKNLVMGGRYRPLSVITFAIEYEFFGLKPGVSHLLNVLFFALTCILLYVVLKRLLHRYSGRKWYLSLPFIATLLFLAHPLHTEVVSNIKGRDEIFTLMGSLLALLFSLKYLESNKIKNLIFGFISFFLAMASKENAITFVLVIPLSVYFFTNYSIRKNMTALIPVVLSTGLFLIIRQLVIGSTSTDIPAELMNDSFLGATISQKYATITYTLVYYIRLLLFPSPLTFDYYPYMIPIINWGDWRAYTSLFLHLAFIIIAFRGLKKKRLISWGIWYYAITFSLTTNILFPIGTFMSERFMYTPSIGFCVILAYLILFELPKLLKNENTYKAVAFGLIGVTFALYSFKTISRNAEWRDDFTLFTSDVKVSGNSAKSNCSAGGKLIEEATKKGNESVRDEYLKLALQYLNRSVEIHPTYADALLLLGNAHFEYNKNFDGVWDAYRKIIVQNPNYEKVHDNLKIMFNKVDSVDAKLKIYEDLYKFAPNRYDVNYELGVTWGKRKNNLEKALFYLENAVKIDPNKVDTYKDLGVAYGLSQNFVKATEYLEKAVKMDPKDPQMFYNLGITYLTIGQEEKGLQALEKAEEIQPGTLKRNNLNLNTIKK